MRAFRTFRNPPARRDSALSLFSDVRRNFAAMSPEQFAAFLETLPAENRATAQAIRDGHGPTVTEH